MKKRLTKKGLNELKAAYKFKCKCRYFGTLTAYFVDFALKVYLIYMVAGIYLAYIGALCDFFAKWYHLKQTKFRKGDFYVKK